VDVYARPSRHIVLEKGSEARIALDTQDRKSRCRRSCERCRIPDVGTDVNHGRGIVCFGDELRKGGNVLRVALVRPTVVRQFV